MGTGPQRLALARGDMVRAENDLRDWLAVWLDAPNASTWEHLEEAAEVYSESWRGLRDSEAARVAP